MYFNGVKKYSITFTQLLSNIAPLIMFGSYKKNKTSSNICLHLSNTPES